MWIFYSNLILQENTEKAKILTETRRDQLTSRIEVAIENRGRDRKLSCQSVPCHDITNFMLCGRKRSPKKGEVVN